MPTLKNFKESFKRNMLKIFFFFSLIGLVGGSFLSMTFMGEHERTYRMGKFTLKELDVQRTGQIIQIIRPELKEKSKKEIQSATIEWIMKNRALSKFAQKNDFNAPKEQIQDFIKNVEYFKNDGAFSQQKYNDFLEFNNVDNRFLKNTLEQDREAYLLRSSLNKTLFSNIKTPLTIFKSFNKESQIDIITANINKVPDYSFKNAKVENHEFLKETYFDLKDLEKEKSSTTLSMSGESLLEHYKSITVNDLIEQNITINKNNSILTVLFNKDKHRELKNQFQKNKKIEFIKQYINDYRKIEDDFSKIADTQDYLHYQESTVSPDNILIDRQKTQEIHNMVSGDVHYFLKNNQITVVKKQNEVSLLTDKEKNELKNNLAKGFKNTFQQLLEKEAVENY